jgi:hypothetical protein
VLEYLQELIEGVLAEFDSSIDLSDGTHRDLVVERLLETIQEEYLMAYSEAELQDELHRLHDENDSLWGMLEELKETDVAKFTEDLKKTIEAKLLEVRLKTFDRSGSEYKN